MKILKMTASFGKLEKQTLELSEGLNVVSLPNESGKSTWAAFLLAMLYGVDTSERMTKTNLPVKKKYEPWSGAAMEGRMDIDWNGRKITLERTSTNRAPMSAFRAYETESGLAVQELTGENCGLVLLGVERSVFERSAFVAQASRAVSSDVALERRLAALVTTGEEEISFSDTQKRLKDQKNHCRHNKTGLLPQLEGELAQVEAVLSQIHNLHRDDLVLREKEQELSQKKKNLAEIMEGLQAQETARKLQSRKEQKQAVAQAEARLAQAQQEAAKVPAAQVLSEIAQKLQQLQAPQAETGAQMPPEQPLCPAVFQGISEDDILPKAQRDTEKYDALIAQKPHKTAIFWVLFGILAVISAAELLIFPPLGACSMLAAAVFLVLAIVGRNKNKKLRQVQKQAQEILSQYGVDAREGIVALAAQYREQVLLYRQEKARYDELVLAGNAHKQAQAEQTARLLGQVSLFAPEANSPAEALDAVQKAQKLHASCEDAQQALAAAQARYDAVCAALGEIAEVRVPQIDVSGYDARAVQEELAQVDGELTKVRQALTFSQGRVQALGDPAALMAEREQFQKRIAQAQARYDALALAEKTLEDANKTLQTRLSPQLCAMAGEILGKLTGARYDTVMLDHELHAEAREADGMAMRSLLSLSGGTADQVYLAVRLAICHLALESDTPIVLDDALVQFDDARMLAALEVLVQEAKTRQILLFSCQSREEAALKNM